MESTTKHDKVVPNSAYADALNPPAVPTPVIWNVHRSERHVQVIIATEPEELRGRGFPWMKIEVSAHRNYGDADKWWPAEISAPSHGSLTCHDMLRYSAAMLMAAGIAQMLNIEHGVQSTAHRVYEAYNEGEGSDVENE